METWRVFLIIVGIVFIVISVFRHVAMRRLKGSEYDNYIKKVVSERDYNNAEKILSGKSAPGLGINSTIAGSIIGLYWLLMLFGRLLGGIVGGRISSKVMLATVSSLAIVFVFIAILLPLDTLIYMPVFQ